MIPEFAVIGHPNEGKSSVVSTLTEDDRIKVSRTPGETTFSQPYTVRIDNKDIIRFVDTPGFQVPRQTLAWFKAYQGSPDKIVESFITEFGHDPFYADECELLHPLTRGAGIIFVVDGSRPVRGDDLAEMEILRLTGRPRMAVINSKTGQKDYTRDWQQEFRKSFNAVRVFNSNTANFMDRIRMLESLKSIDQEWEKDLARVVEIFKEEWRSRNKMAAQIMLETFEACLRFSADAPLLDPQKRRETETRLNREYQAAVRDLESRMFKKIRSLYKHHLYEVRLPEHMILQHDLFSKQTWELLGLTRRQLAAAGAVVGGTVGAVLDTAAAGITFGVFTAIGGIFGAGSALYGGARMAGKKRLGLSLGGAKIRVGPNRNPQLLYVLVDRALIYYAAMVNRPHGKRKDLEANGTNAAGKQGATSQFSGEQRAVCAAWFKSIAGKSLLRDKNAAQKFQDLIETTLKEICEHGPDENIKG